jgi:hypothetical protein
VNHNDEHSEDSATVRHERTFGLKIDAKVTGNPGEAGRVALTNCPELPFGAVPVQLTEHHCGLGGGVFGQVVAGQFRLVGGVDDPDERVPNLSERLAPGIAVIDGDREDDGRDLGRCVGQVDLDLLVVALTLAGEVVTGVLDRAIRGLEIVEEDKVLIGEARSRASAEICDRPFWSASLMTGVIRPSSIATAKLTSMLSCSSRLSST